MRIYDTNSICRFYLSPYCVASICSNAIKLEHRLSGDIVLLQPLSVPLRSLWEQLNRGGTEMDWHQTLAALKGNCSPSLEELIQRGFLE